VSPNRRLGAMFRMMHGFLRRSSEGFLFRTLAKARQGLRVALAGPHDLCLHDLGPLTVNVSNLVTTVKITPKTIVTCFLIPALFSTTCFQELLYKWLELDLPQRILRLEMKFVKIDGVAQTLTVRSSFRKTRKRLLDQVQKPFPV
jgi:hypothetical protein